MLTRLGPALGALLAVATAFEARADEEAGKRLFGEGKAAMAAHDYAKACAKFEASYAESNVAGALLSWADCEEQRGRIGTALGLWHKGAAAVAADPVRSSFVQARIAALELRVPKVTVKVPAPLAYAKARIDGREVPLGVATAVDPGSLEVSAEVPGLPPETRRIDVGPGTTITVELLGAAAPPPGRATAPRQPLLPSPTTPEPRPGGSASGLVVGGWVAGGVGLAGAIGFGITGGLLLDSCHGTLDPCGGARGSDAGEALALTRSNMALAVIGLAGLGTGAILLGIGYGESGGNGSQARAGIRVGSGTIVIDGAL